MKKIPLILFLLLFYASISFGQEKIQITIPDSNDKYSEFVRQLEAGETNIDFLEFRESFLASEQFKKSHNQSKFFDSLEQVMYVRMDEKDYQGVIATTIEMLSIDYTSMLAHKILRQTYEILDQPEKAEQYKSIQFGLLKSIVQNGDGKSCETAWPVIQIEEEYFILDMLEAELIEQSFETTNGLCDKMVVKVEGQTETYYFDVKRIFAAKKVIGEK